MKLKIALTSVQSSRHVLPQLSFASRKPKSLIASPSSLAKCTISYRALVCRYAHSSTCSSMKIAPSQSFHKPSSRGHTIKRACRENFDEFFDYELSKQIEGLGQKFDPSDEEENEEHWTNCTLRTTSKSSSSSCRDSFLPSKIELLEPLEWPKREEVLWASIERKANSVDIPLSLRMIKKKQQRLEGFRFSGGSACCSVNGAFSSMVLIILELQSNALQMRELLSCEDLEGVIARVQREMHGSFVWLFQQVFSRTPSLMIYVMILLANFSEHSMANNIANQGPSFFGIMCETTEEVSITEKQDQEQSQFKMVPGSNSGGGKVHVDGSTVSIQHPNSVLDHISWFSSNEECKLNEKEADLWKSVVDEATRMVAEVRDGVLDHETMQQLVSPVTVELEPDNYVDYYRTDLVYQMGLSRETNNPLLLSNYAQFLFLVAHDYDRAEECFKRAIQVEPLDAEAVSQYANFLWIVRGNLWEAEERYQQAMAAEPENPYHVSKYASFLWNTGGEETCFPLNTSHENREAQNL